MSERIDHAAKALRCLNASVEHYDHGDNVAASLESSAAIAHSNLAIAEQLRVANLMNYIKRIADTSDVVAVVSKEAKEVLGL